MCKTCEDAWASFERWLDGQPQEVRDLSITEQIELYSKEQ